MSGILFDEIVFGPVKSRRFGVSLGVNLLPLQAKLCSFDCIYCECGLNAEHRPGAKALASAGEIAAALQNRFMELKSKGITPDNITFAGNGEPTMHPEFEAIIEKTKQLRDQFFEKAKITVLSNATQLAKASVRRALSEVDQNVLKLDAGTNETFRAINCPQSKITLEEIVEHLRLFNHGLIVQTMLVRGEVNGKWVDNTTEDELKLWLQHIEYIQPSLVMLYPVDRETPYSTIEKVPETEFKNLAKRVKALGIPAEVFY